MYCAVLMARLHRQSSLNDIITGDLFKQPAVPPPPPIQPAAKNTIPNQQRQTAHVFAGGRLMKRRRF